MTAKTKSERLRRLVSHGYDELDDDDEDDDDEVEDAEY
jgi:hypothetical protein